MLLITDEVQCGVYRTGEFVTSAFYGIKPDIITFAKGLGGGVGIGACVSRKTIFAPGDHGSTFGGNFLATTTGLVTIKELKRLKKSGKLDEISAKFNENLEKLARRYPKIFETKQGIELAKIISLALKHRVLVLRSGAKTLRFLPPLNISKKEMKEGFARLSRALDEYEI